MADLSTPHADDAFAAQTRRVVARRAGLGLGFMLGLAAVAGVLELAYYPDRLGRLAAAFATEAILCAAALLAIRGARLRRFVVPITSAAAFAIVGCMTLYVVWAGASGDALAIALVLALSGVALLCPWGARAQVPLALGTLAAYLLALAHGVRGGLPVPYGILCVGGGAVTSILGAIFLDLHRRATTRRVSAAKASSAWGVDRSAIRRGRAPRETVGLSDPECQAKLAVDPAGAGALHGGSRSNAACSSAGVAIRCFAAETMTTVRSFCRSSWTPSEARSWRSGPSRAPSAWGSFEVSPA